MPASGGAAKNLNSNAQNHPVDNHDSSNGGLVFVDNTETIAMSKEEISRFMNLPNNDMNIDDVEIIPTKPRMPAAKRQRVSRHGAMKNYALQHEQG